MATTDKYAGGGLAFGGTADLEFVHGPQVEAEVEILWDFNGDGRFDGEHDNVTDLLYEVETFTGRDWPSQLQGKAGPGRLSLRLRNDDDRFSYFNGDSPLNQDGNSLDPGRLIRLQIEGTTDVDPILLRRDRFDGTGAITNEELGTAWEHQPATSSFLRIDGNAGQFSSGGTESLMVVDTGVADYYAQVTFSDVGDNVKATAALQEVNRCRLIYRWQDTSNYSYFEVRPEDGVQTLAYEAADVVAGVTSSHFSGALLATNGSSASGEHRRRVTLGVAVVGSAVDYYVDGVDIGLGETAIQTDETHVGIYAYYGVGNRSPAVDEFAVYDRVAAPVEGVIWTGHVTDVMPRTVPGGPKVVDVTAEGVLTTLATTTINPAPWAGANKTGLAVGEALERAGLAYPPGEIAVGDQRAGSSADAEITALAHVRKLEEVERGFFHETPEGWPRFEERSYRESASVVATFSDAEGAQHQYTSLDLLAWRKELINKVTAGVSYGAPDLVSVGGGNNSSTATGVNHPIELTIPTVLDGDLLTVIIASTVDSNSEQWLVPLFWVRERDTGASVSRRTQVYTHVCAATDSGNVVRFYNDTANAGGSHILRYYHFRNWYGTHEGIHVGPWAVGTSFSGADPEPILPPWGDTNPTAYFAQRAGTRLSGSGAVANSTFPLGFLNGFAVFQNGTSSDDDDAGMQMCSRLAMSPLEDPATFTGFTNLQNSETSVIAVRGYNGSTPEPRGRLRVEAEDVDSQRKHGVVATYDACDLFMDEDDAEEWCALMLTRYAQTRPILRISFVATYSSTMRTQAYARRLSDKIRVVANGSTGMGIDGDFHIESIAHRLSDAGKLWITTWELSPV